MRRTERSTIRVTAKVTLISWLRLPLNGVTPSGGSLGITSALCPLPTGTNFTVSPGAILSTAGSNTMVCPLAPLFSM